MKNKILLTIVTAIGITAAATQTMAAPLPDGTKLTISPMVYAPNEELSAFGCSAGSCFGFQIFTGIYAWIPLEPGTDGGIIIGKAQKSGGQDTDYNSTNPGEITAKWVFAGNNGTFFTAPSAAGNVFNDASCTGSGCGSNTTPRLTDLAVWNMAWAGQAIPTGSASGCDKTLLSYCTADNVAGIFVSSWTIDPPTATPRKYELKYDQVLPQSLVNQGVKMTLRGEVDTSNTVPVVSATPANLMGVNDVPIPFAINVTNGLATPTCRVGTAPAHGMVVLTGCIAGTYTADLGFVGTDSFTIIANNGQGDSAPFALSAAITGGQTSCTAQHSVRTIILSGKRKQLRVSFSGNIVSWNSSAITICPTTVMYFMPSTITAGATATCKVNKAPVTGAGVLNVNDNLQCTDKPVGSDTLNVSIKGSAM